MWETRHGKLGDEWFPLDEPAWRPPRPGDEGVMYKVMYTVKTWLGSRLTQP